jgi:hypothetical protein
LQLQQLTGCKKNATKKATTPTKTVLLGLLDRLQLQKLGDCNFCNTAVANNETIKALRTKTITTSA